MLVKLTDIKDDVYWINPSYVRVVRWNEKKRYTEVHCVAGGGVMTGVIKVKQPIDDIVMQLNVGMLGASDLAPGTTDTSAASNPGAQAAMNAAFLG